MEFGPGGGVKKCCAEKYTLLYLSVPPFSFPRTFIRPMASFFSRKARSAPKRQSSRRVAPKARKGLSARAKSTIRKTVAAIAGLGGAAALTYAGLFLANHTKVKKCLDAKDIVEWRKLKCDQEMESMMTNAGTKKKMKSQRAKLHSTGMGVVERSRTSRPFDINARNSGRFNKRSASQRKKQYEQSMSNFGSVVNELQKKTNLKRVNKKDKKHHDGVSRQEKINAAFAQNLQGFEKLPYASQSARGTAGLVKDAKRLQLGN